MLKWKPAAGRGLWASVTHGWATPAKMRKKCCYGQKNLGQYVAVCPRLQLTSHTQPTSTLSRIKCERCIFIKKCVRSFIEVRHYCWLCFRIYLYMYMYTCKFVYGYTAYSYLVPKASLCPHGIVSNLSEPRRSKIRPIKVFEKEEKLRENRKQNATLWGRTRHEKKEEKWRDRGKEQRKMQETGRKKKTKTDQQRKTEKMKKKRETLQRL